MDVILMEIGRLINLITLLHQSINMPIKREYFLLSKGLSTIFQVNLNLNKRDMSDSQLYPVALNWIKNGKDFYIFLSENSFLFSYCINL